MGAEWEKGEGEGARWQLQGWVKHRIPGKCLRQLIENDKCPVKGLTLFSSNDQNQGTTR